MSDAVLDACFLRFCDRSPMPSSPSEVLLAGIYVLRQVYRGAMGLRYNPVLEQAYNDHVFKSGYAHSDFVQAIQELLDRRPIHVERLDKSTLPRAQRVRARECRWPLHDAHLLAAAWGGDEPAVYTTERRLAACATCVSRDLGIKVWYFSAR